MKATVIPALLAAALPLLATTQAFAQEERNQTIVLYGVGAFLDGDITFGERESAVDVDASDILDSLEMAAFLRYRAQNESWAFVFDGQYASLGGVRDSGSVETELDTNFYIFQADAAYRFTERSEVLFGVRYVRFETTVDLRFAGDGALRREGDASFWDPVVGLRTVQPLGENFRLQVQGDIGGGANMDLTWQGMVNLGWQVSDGASLWLGYRGLGMDFDDGGGNNRIDADIVMHGPELGVAFHF
jgi:hypothetical protein